MTLNLHIKYNLIFSVFLLFSLQMMNLSRLQTEDILQQGKEEAAELVIKKWVNYKLKKFLLHNVNSSEYL